MSLENEIKKLTAAIAELTAELKNPSTEVAPTVNPTIVVEEKEVVVVSDKVEEKVVEAVSAALALTHDDLKEALLKAARRDRKQEVKALLETYNAKKVSDVKEKDIAEIIEKAEAL